MLSKFSVQGDTAPRFLYSVHIKLKVWAVGSYSSGPPAGGTYVLMSTEYRNQGDVSPCNAVGENLLNGIKVSYLKFGREAVTKTIARFYRYPL